MLLTAGLFFVAFGVLAELLGGTMFRSFFDWRNYPPRYPKGVRGNDVRVRTLAARVTLLVGVALTLAGLVRLVA